MVLLDDAVEVLTLTHTKRSSQHALVLSSLIAAAYAGFLSTLMKSSQKAATGAAQCCFAFESPIAKNYNRPFLQTPSSKAPRHQRHPARSAGCAWAPVAMYTDFNLVRTAVTKKFSASIRSLLAWSTSV